MSDKRETMMTGWLAQLILDHPEIVSETQTFAGIYGQAYRHFNKDFAKAAEAIGMTFKEHQNNENGTT